MTTSLPGFSFRETSRRGTWEQGGWPYSSFLGILITFCLLLKVELFYFQVVVAVLNVVKRVTLRENVPNKKTMVEEEVRDNVIIILLCRMVIKCFLPLFVEV